MEGLSRCAELQRSANSRGWEEAMILYCRRSIVEDCKMARETKRVFMRDSEEGYGEDAAVANLREGDGAKVLLPAVISTMLHGPSIAGCMSKMSSTVNSPAPFCVEDVK
ncbi:hypothetical protein Tco_1230921 [Tanacetum coccineum]